MRRKAVPRGMRNKSVIKTFPAPVRGWITNENIANAQPFGAAVLDNFFPLANSLRERGGLLRHATVHATLPCETLMAYRGGAVQKMFAATATAIYDVTTPVSPTAIPTAALTGQTSGDYSWINFATAGGQFLAAANGVDRLIYFDNATWRRIDTATTELPFDAQTVNYGAPGIVVTGGTSLATGVIVEVIDNGATGTLRLKTVVGTFVDNELVTASTGSATANIPSGVTLVPSVTAPIDTTTIGHIWTFKSRIFALKKNSLTAYAFPVDSLGGAVTTLSLAGVMQKGGSLMIGATWSTDAGDGLDDVCVFISDQGEVAVYQGNDPSSFTDWQLVGVYPMTEIIHKTAYMRAGGDLLVASKDGLIPISSAVSKDKAALPLSAVSLAIEPTWRKYVADRPGKWAVGKWTAKNMGIIGIPPAGDGTSACFVVNLQTGAWARFTGWDVRCALEFGSKMYIGTSKGKVLNCEQSGYDDGAIYTSLFVGSHERVTGPTQEKVALMARATWRRSTAFNFNASFGFDYGYELGAYPSVPIETVTDLWDVGLWDVAKWDGRGVQIIQTEWESTAGRGFAVAPVVQMASGTNTIPDVELISIDLLYEVGAIVT